MAARWDAPYAFRARYAEQDDPPPPDSAEVPRFMLEKDFDPDLLLGIAQSYAGQVTLLDLCVGALLEFLHESPIGRRDVARAPFRPGVSVGVNTAVSGRATKRFTAS